MMGSGFFVFGEEFRGGTGEQKDGGLGGPLLERLLDGFPTAAFLPAHLLHLGAEFSLCFVLVFALAFLFLLRLRPVGARRIKPSPVRSSASLLEITHAHASREFRQFFAQALSDALETLSAPVPFQCG